MDFFLVRLQVKSLINAIALREALWSRMVRSLPLAWPSKWATQLLACYHAVSLEDEALAFKMRRRTQLLDHHQRPSQEACMFARAAVRTYVAANLLEDALQFQEAFLPRLDPRASEHNLWARHRRPGTSATATAQ